MLAYSRIGRPEEEHGARCTSVEAYRCLQAMHFAEAKAKYPRKPWPDPFVTATAGTPQIHQGIWKVDCVCGNWPIFDPEWQEACCFTCGAIHQVAPPKDWRDIEAVLLARPEMTTRNYLPGETLDDLRAENFAHGDPVPEMEGVPSRT